MKASDVIKKRIEFLGEKADKGRFAPAGSFEAQLAGAWTERLLEAKLILPEVLAAEASEQEEED